MPKSSFTSQIENKLKALAPEKLTGKIDSEMYIKGNGKETCKLKFLKLTVPAVRNLAKEIGHNEEFFSDMQNLWFETDYFDARLLAVVWLDRQKVPFLMKNHKQILNWAGEIDNWAHSDGLCAVYARMFDFDQKLLLPTYLKWNVHRNPWLRRCSMVGTFYYSRSRENQPAFALAKKLVTPHLKAEEYYVQKGVGWTVREMYNVYPNETIKYISNNINELSPIAWVAASEKLPAAIKQPLLQKRKLSRLNG